MKRRRLVAFALLGGACGAGSKYPPPVYEEPKLPEWTPPEPEKEDDPFGDLDNLEGEWVEEPSAEEGPPEKAPQEKDAEEGSVEEPSEGAEKSGNQPPEVSQPKEPTVEKTPGDSADDQAEVRSDAPPGPETAKEAESK